MRQFLILFTILFSVQAVNAQQILRKKKENNLWGFVDTSGQVVIDYQYQKVHDFHETVALVQKENLTYKTFMHTWKMKDGIQNLWDKTIPQKIDYEEYKLLSPDFYQLDDEDEFLESVNMDIYFYKDVYAKKGNTPDGEWVPKMVSNHVCMLESQKRGLSMVQTAISKGDKYKETKDISLKSNNDPNTKITSEHSNPSITRATSSRRDTKKEEETRPRA